MKRLIAILLLLVILCIPVSAQDDMATIINQICTEIENDIEIPSRFFCRPHLRTRAQIKSGELDLPPLLVPDEINRRSEEYEARFSILEPLPRHVASESVQRQLEANLTTLSHDIGFFLDEMDGILAQYIPIMRMADQVEPALISYLNRLPVGDMKSRVGHLRISTRVFWSIYDAWQAKRRVLVTIQQRIANEDLVILQTTASNDDRSSVDQSDNTTEMLDVPVNVTGTDGNPVDAILNSAPDSDDFDGDGVPDAQDQCKNEIGTPPDGCPSAPQPIQVEPLVPATTRWLVRSSEGDLSEAICGLSMIERLGGNSARYTHVATDASGRFWRWETILTWKDPMEVGDEIHIEVTTSPATWQGDGTIDDADRGAPVGASISARGDQVILLNPPDVFGNSATGASGTVRFLPVGGVDQLEFTISGGDSGGCAGVLNYYTLTPSE